MTLDENTPPTPTVHSQDFSKPVMTSAPQQIACHCGGVHFEDWDGWGTPIEAVPPTEQPTETGAAAPTPPSTDAEDAPPGAGGFPDEPVKVIDLVGPIAEGSIVVVRRPSWLDDPAAPEDAAAAFIKNLGEVLTHAAGHKSFALYLTSPEDGGIAVLSAEEIEAAADRHRRLEDLASAFIESPPTTERAHQLGDVLATGASIADRPWVTTPDGIAHIGENVHFPLDAYERCTIEDPETHEVVYDGPAPAPAEWWDEHSDRMYWITMHPKETTAMDEEIPDRRTNDDVPPPLAASDEGDAIVGAGYAPPEREDDGATD